MPRASHLQWQFPSFFSGSSTSTFLLPPSTAPHPTPHRCFSHPPYPGGYLHLVASIIDKCCYTRDFGHHYPATKPRTTDMDGLDQTPFSLLFPAFYPFPLYMLQRVSTFRCASFLICYLCCFRIPLMPPFVSCFFFSSAL